MKYLLQIVIVFGLALNLYALEYKAVFSETFPKLDGKIEDDPAWQNAAWADGFKVFSSDKDAKLKTRFKLIYTSNAVYIAVECRDPKIEQIKTGAHEIWHDDNVEVFFSSDILNCKHFTLNAAGKKANEMITPAGKTDRKNIWNWDAATKISSGKWCAEIMIPYNLFPEVPSKSLRLYFNLGRTANSVNEISSWAFQKYSFHDVENFGKISFIGEISPQKIKLMKDNRKKYATLAKIKLIKRQWEEFVNYIQENKNSFNLSFYESNKDEFRKIEDRINNLHEADLATLLAIEKEVAALKGGMKEFDYNIGQKLVNEIINSGF